MTQAALLHPDRLFPADSAARALARDLFDTVRDLPIVSPHGHTDPAWFADNTVFADPSALFLTPDHYVLRLLHSQGVAYDDLAVPRIDGRPVADSRSAWRLFAAHWHLFRGTPSRLWIEHALAMFFGITEELDTGNADAVYDTIADKLSAPALRPMAILDRAGVETIATTEFALDGLLSHQRLAAQGLIGRVRTTYRPDDVTDPDNPHLRSNLRRLGEMTGHDIQSWDGLIEAHRARRAAFRAMGAVATDHGTATAATADLATHEKQALLDRVLGGPPGAADAELFRAQMLTEMAGLSTEDGMVMQLHAGSRRNQDPGLWATHGANLGADIPAPVDMVGGLAPLLARYGNATNLQLVVFTMDETTYARELAPMAGYWPCLRLGPPWWFHDSPHGMRRYFDQTVESAGFANLAGFNDDTRALLSIPARHDMWRREVCGYLARQVTEFRFSRSSAAELAAFLSHGAAKKAYRLP